MVVLRFLRIVEEGFGPSMEKRGLLYRWIVFRVTILIP